MGTGYAHLIANLFLFCYERKIHNSFFQNINQLMLLKHLNQHLNIWLIFQLHVLTVPTYKGRSGGAMVLGKTSSSGASY